VCRQSTRLARPPGDISLVGSSNRLPIWLLGPEAGADNKYTSVFLHIVSLGALRYITENLFQMCGHLFYLFHIRCTASIISASVYRRIGRYQHTKLRKSLTLSKLHREPRLPPFCKQNLLLGLFIQPRWQLRRTYMFNHYIVLF